MTSSSASTSSELFRESVVGEEPTAEELLIARRAESIPPPGTGGLLDVTA